MRLWLVHVANQAVKALVGHRALLALFIKTVAERATNLEQWLAMPIMKRP
jgi:hypothetical protein